MRTAWRLGLVLSLMGDAVWAADQPGQDASRGSGQLPPQQIALYHDPESPWKLAPDNPLLRRLAAGGHAVVRLDRGKLSDPRLVTPDAFSLVIVWDARRVPARGIENLAAYVARGGKLMVLGGPFFQHTLWQYGERWLDRPGVLAAVADELRPKSAPVFDFESPALGAWRHSSSKPKSDSVVRRVSPGAAGSQGAMEMELVDVTGWDTFVSPPVEQPFAQGRTWTTFWAKAEDEGAQLMIEWQEQDRSRWIAVVDLASQWKFFALPPAAFRFWHDPAVPGRGHGTDVLRPQNAVSLTVGVAQSHTSWLPSPGKHRLWIDQLGTAPAPAGLEQAPWLGGPQTPPCVIETVSPTYKLYPVTNASRLRVNDTLAKPKVADRPSAGAPHRENAGSARGVPWPMPGKPGAAWACHPRPQGTGFAKGRRWRYVPLLEWLDEQGEVAGAGAWLMIHGPAAGDGGMVAGVGVADPDFLAQERVFAWLGELAARMIDGVFLYEAGARYDASFGEEAMPVGATVTHRGRGPATLALDAEIRDGDDNPVWKQSFSLELLPGQTRSVEAPWRVPAGPRDPYRVSVVLRREGVAIDRAEHQVRVWRPKAKPEYVTARKGDFFLGDQPWYAHGVNYMPSSGIASEDWQHFEFWLGAHAYDPDVIERDLRRVKSIGLNMVSVFIDHRSVGSRNLLDFLMRCEDHALKVNLSLRPGTPMDFQWEKMRQIVLAHRLPENDTVFAYDLAWEPTWGPRDRRKPYDRPWQAWVEKRYGTLAAAERAWNFAPPREAGLLAGPSDEQVSRDGPWRAMVLDYRRFLDELLDERYGRARKLMRSVDPHHLVSFRMTIAGDPTVPPASMAYDLAGLARSVDFMAPEGYGRIGDWQRVRPGWFTVAYSRAVAPELPVLWAEFGYSIWNETSGGPSPERLAFTERFYDDFYRMAYESGSSGTVAWFFPGGYRYNEKSDYGILNPDGSWRPHTHVIHRWAEKMTRPRPIHQPDVLIPFTLYHDVDGIAGIYRRVGRQFWEAVDAGKRPGLRQEGGSGGSP